MAAESGQKVAKSPKCEVMQDGDAIVAPDLSGPRSDGRRMRTLVKVLAGKRWENGELCWKVHLFPFAHPSAQ